MILLFHFSFPLLFPKINKEHGLTVLWPVSIDKQYDGACYNEQLNCLNEQQNSLTARSVIVLWLVEGVTVSVQYRSDLFVLWTSENSEGLVRREGTCDEALRTSACDIKGRAVQAFFVLGNFGYPF